MVINKKSVIYAADFETTVYEGQDSTEVWSAACARLYSDEVLVYHSIEEFFEYLFGLRRNLILYYHNVRFDGSFIVNYLLRNGWSWSNAKRLDSYEFTTLISGKNRWYSITIQTPKAKIEIRDSAKLMPMSLAEMGTAFNTEHRKKEMEYMGYRYAGCSITKEEMDYIINDVLVLKEALEFMLGEGHTKLTIGSCAMEEYKNKYGKEFFNLFPDQKSIEIDPIVYGVSNADAYVRKSYKGGFCYVRKDRVGRQSSGRTFDVNSLYPSIMHSRSGNPYPIGNPHFWSGDIPEEALKRNRIYFVRFKCRFNVKKNYLPTVQIKGSPLYKGTKWLETSDIEYRGKVYDYYYDSDGNKVTPVPVMTMTCVDYNLFLEHYNVTELEVLDGCWYYGRVGMFDDYIDFWMDRKQKSKGGARAEAKLFLNSLYGKFSSSDDSSYRVPVLTDNGLRFDLVEENEKETCYIPVGAMVTSYARYFTITHGQLNYDLFCYSDTDSLHLLDGTVKGIDVHPTNMLSWKQEKEWSSAIFMRQKTYAEFVRKIDGEKVYPHWEITAAGMPDRSKKIFLAEHPITDFKYGLSVRGKLMPKQIKGGVILENKNFTLRR